MAKNKKKAIKESKNLKEGYIGQTLQDFLDLCVDADFINKIYVYGTDDIVYEGSMDELPDDMRDASFMEFDAYSNGRDIVTANVDSSLEYGYDAFYEFLGDFLDDCNNENVVIFDLDQGEEIYRGDRESVPDEIRDMAFASFDTPDELSVNLSDYEGDSDDYDDDEEDEEFDEALGKVQEITRAVDSEGNEYHVKPIWKTDRLATLVDKDGKETKVELADIRQFYDLYDQDDEVISRYEDYLDEALKENEQPFYRVVKDPKGKGYCILKRVNKLDKSNTFINDHSKEVFNTPDEAKAMLDKVDELHFHIEDDELLKESTVPVKDLLVKTDNKYDITLDHAIDDIKKKKGNPHDSLLGDEGAISTLMKRFGLEKRDVIRALNYKFDGKVLDESVEDDMEKLPHVVMAFKDGGVNRLELEWRPSTKKAHSDYIDLSQAIKDKFGDANIKVKKQEWRDGNKETRYVLEVTLKDDATIYEGLDEAYNTEDRIKELKEIKKTRALTDDELEELAYCENEVSSREAEKNYLNGESLDENWVKHYRGFDYYEDENEPKYIITKSVDGKVVDKFVIDATTSQEVKDYIDNNLIKKGAKQKITEAPDDLGFLTDEEIEEQERQEFEKRLAQRKADRDKAKKDEQDKLDQEQAKEKAKQDAIAKGKELYNKVKDLPLDDWFEYLVPSSGKASTVAGELVRAVNRLTFRNWNDGDLFYQGYGRETCGAPAVYLMYTIEDTYPILNELTSKEGEEYASGLEQLKDVVYTHLLKHPELFEQINEDDCNDKERFDIDVEFEEPREYDFTVFANDYNDDYGISLRDYINAGHVTSWDFQDKVKEFVEGVLNNDNFTMATPWSHYDEEIQIEHLTKEEYDTLGNEFQDSQIFDDWLKELYDEYGDPNEEPEDDEVEESVKKDWDTIEFKYDKLPITKLDSTTLERTPMEIDYTHKVTQEDVEDALFNILEKKGELDDFSLEGGVDYVMNHFDELVDKYEDELKDLFRDGAINTAENKGLDEDLSTFDDQMDFLAKDEDEAIAGYKEVIKKVDNDNVKSQLKKIETEEKAHKDYLTKVKDDKNIKYTEPLDEDTVKQGNKWVNKGNTGKTHGEFKTKKEADAQRRAMFAGKKPNAKWGK